jgi:hypothetical protein
MRGIANLVDGSQHGVLTFDAAPDLWRRPVGINGNR